MLTLLPALVQCGSVVSCCINYLEIDGNFESERQVPVFKLWENSYSRTVASGSICESITLWWRQTRYTNLHHVTQVLPHKYLGTLASQSRCAAATLCTSRALLVMTTSPNDQHMSTLLLIRPHQRLNYASKHQCKALSISPGARYWGQLSVCGHCACSSCALYVY
jgi:hypothetical protein